MASKAKLRTSKRIWKSIAVQWRRLAQHRRDDLDALVVACEDVFIANFDMIDGQPHSLQRLYEMVQRIKTSSL